jgi:L-2-hydroxycarboxylate dehydrogenase (NAD+)
MYRVDGKGGFGQVAAQAATDIIIEEVGQNRPVAVTVHNTNHCGMLAYYTRQIAGQYALGFMAVNTNPNVPAFGGAEKVLGTNPFSVSIPWKEDCILIDMATTAIAKGKIYQYEKSGQSLPEGYALDKNGFPTQDPKEAINGMLLPFAGHKGYAISLAVEILAGLVSGAGYSKHTYSLHAEAGKQQNLGAYLHAVPLAPLLDRRMYDERMEDFASILKSGKKAPGGGSIYLPGEIEQETEKKHRTQGIEVEDALADQIKKL